MLRGRGKQIVVRERCRASRFEADQDFRDHPAYAFQRLDDGDRAVILFEDAPDALLDFGWDGVNIEGEFGLCHVGRAYVSDRSACFSRLFWPASASSRDMRRQFLAQPPCPFPKYTGYSGEHD